VRRFRVLRLAAFGQVDAVMASLATFVLHVWVVREFSLVQIGAWGLVFAAFVNASQFPAQFHLTPVEISAVRHDRPDRIGVLRSSVWRGTIVAAGAAVFVVLGALPLIGSVDIGFLAALGFSGMLAATVSPIQDHVRRVMHLAGRSVVAALMSVVQAVVVVAGIVLLPHTWAPVIPFGALTMANLASTAFGLVAVRIWEAERVQTPGVKAGSRVGGWLTGVSVAGGLTGYFTNALIATLTSVETLGLVEAARVVARPVQVAGQGVNAVLGPRSMEAAAEAEEGKAKRARVQFFGLLTMAAAPIGLLVLVPPTRRLIADFVPVAFEEPTLALATVGAFWLAAFYLPYNSELMAGGRHRALAVASVGVALVQLAAVATFKSAGAFVFPISVVVTALVRVPLFARLSRRIYRPPS
jgi:O-antigen/teichoic acid export membrane protein